MTLITSRRALLSSKRSGLVVVDSFNRADSATTLGVADTGQTWNVGDQGDLATLPTFGISGNAAYEPAIGNRNHGHAWVESGVSDLLLQCTVTPSNAAGIGRTGVLFRRQDANNYFLVRLVNSSDLIALVRNLAGVASIVLQTALTLADATPVLLEVLAVGQSIKVYADSALIFDTADGNMALATKHGIMGDNDVQTGASYENFKVYGR